MPESDLRAAGLRSTDSRRKILDVLESQASGHSSVEEIHRVLLETDGDFSIATVYRVLSDFESAGLVTRRHLGPTISVYALKTSKPRDYIICVSCGRSQEFEDAGIEKRQVAVGKRLGFTIADRALTLYGHCPECRPDRKSKLKRPPTAGERLRGARLLTAKRRLRQFSPR